MLPDEGALRAAEVYLSFSIFPNLDDLLLERTYFKESMFFKEKKEEKSAWKMWVSW